ncbi:ribosomal RNA adenine methyltransferase KsgA/Erm [Spinellus fusiger]|nr:ribosomal RNA adenine methyltransferase KsgA/Erm [Spinellus fusiger]
MNCLHQTIPKVPSMLSWTKQLRLRGSAKPPRSTLASYKVAEEALAKLNIKNPETMSAVEIYPGLGVWTTALANYGFKKIVSMEPSLPYYTHMETVVEHPSNAINLLRLDGYNWETYNELKKDNYLGETESKDWSEVRRDLLFTGTMPCSVKGEQLLAQFASCINNKMAIYTMGRIEMAMWMPETLYSKIASPPGSSKRCKMSVVAEACTDINLVYVSDKNAFYPHNPYCLVHFVPHEKSKVTSHWDVFEYVLKHLFVMQRQPLSKMIK